MRFPEAAHVPDNRVLYRICQTNEGFVTLFRLSYHISMYLHKMSVIDRNSKKTYLYKRQYDKTSLPMKNGGFPYG